MDFLSALNISGSGLTAQKLRMDVISQNIANAQVTMTQSGRPYRRKVVVLNSTDVGFKSALDKAVGKKANGVHVSRIVEDPSPFVPVYDPSHPNANDEGYVMMPNVNTTQEIIDMLGASRAYESNVTAFNAMKSMALKALDIGR
ncbi:MAG TPA: flagellar basal body rod protein FlgC [Anaerovoracaceae bacterium]|nr:flagellar basal body rod protein FlgC [Anaerovoracaceae bacterium]